MWYTIIYALIVFLAAAINSYRKGCAAKKAYIGWGGNDAWDVLICSLLWPLLLAYVILKPLGLVVALPYKLGRKYGCPGKK